MVIKGCGLGENYYNLVKTMGKFSRPGVFKNHEQQKKFLLTPFQQPINNPIAG